MYYSVVKNQSLGNSIPVVTPVVVYRQSCYVTPQNTTEDSFQKSKAKKSNPWKAFTIGFGALSAGLVGALALTKGKMQNLVELVGKKPAGSFKSLFAQIQELVSKDAMTGLGNKCSLLSSLEKEYKKAIESGKTFGVAMFDLDNFKQFNELKGHAHGDITLKRIAANIIEVATRHDAKAFRYGGEEFVVTTTGKSAEEMKIISTEIADAIKKDKIIQAYLPELKKLAAEKIKFTTAHGAKIQEIFACLRRERPTQNYRVLANSIIKVVDSHIKTFNPSNVKTLKEIIKKLKSTPDKDLEEILKISTPLDSGNSTLGFELNKIYNQYLDLRPDCQKWLHHLDRHKSITISGGYVNLDSNTPLKHSSTTVKIADAALGIAKNNGKNAIIEADSHVVKQTVRRVKDELSK